MNHFTQLRLLVLSSIVQVAVNVPLYQTFDYLCEFSVAIGARVKVPFGRKKMIGIVLGHKDKSDFSKLKQVEQVIDDEPILDPTILDFLQWASNYYHHPIGEVLCAAMPKNLRLGKPAIIKKTPTKSRVTKPADFEPTEEQNSATKSIVASLDTYQPFLLFGITGSGKTEVYLNAAEKALSQQKQVLVLVPEIGLTPQMVKRFNKRLDTLVVSIHSQLNETQKLDAYLLAKQGSAGVVLGTRSAIFTPMPNLGLIIVDEEHDNSFKQQSGFRYNARDLSFIRAKKSHIPVVFGTATPSLETLKNVVDQKIKNLTLAGRATGAKMPLVTLIDTSRDAINQLSTQLIESIKQTLDNNKQAMVFINRRGYAPIYFCPNCGWRALCEHCDATMVYHHGINRLKCHHCNAEHLPQNCCPECDHDGLEVLGYGTERLEKTLESYFPKASIIRIDRDTTRRKKSFNQHLEKINSGESCIIVGTQMLAKGHDFANLDMVGVIDVDMGLLSLDFRATEHLAQLLIQVSGRAGRAKDQGEVVIQTRFKDHLIFQHVLRSRYLTFANHLLKERQRVGLPPFSFQALLCANAKNKKVAWDFLTEAAALIQQIDVDGVDLWGPAPALIEKKSDYYYCNLYLQSNARAELHQTLSTFVNNTHRLKLINKVRWYLDVDPIEN